MGKMNPESNMVGNIKPIREIIIAVCCVAERVEIKIPKANDVMINSTLSIPNRNKLPLTGTLKTKMLNNTITTALITDRNMYGNTLPIIT